MENKVTVISKGNLVLPIDIDKIQDIIDESVQSLEDYDEISLTLNRLYDFGQAVQKVSFSMLEKIRKEYIERLQKTHQKERERLLETKPRKERYTKKEVLEITGIKSETTLLKYFANGTIAAQKDSSGRWYVLRDDLKKYVGHDNF